jgi:hypothetical protein
MSQPNWVTAAGSIGSYPALVLLSVQLLAQPVSPATTLTYKLISGSLPRGLSISTNGLISGTPNTVISDTTSNFVIRVTDNLNQIRDRTFSMIISGVSSPELTTLTGSILNTPDSTWVQLPIEYNNPVSNNIVTIRIIQGQLPPGLEINTNGLIRGYAEPPINNVNLGAVNTSITATSSNIITCLSTTGFRIGRPIIFSGTSFGGIIASQTYYIKTIIDESSFIISNIAGGSTVVLSNEVGYMTAILPNISVGQPTSRTYSFTVKLESLLGSDIESYNITVVNQNAPEAEGGPKPANSREPTIYNTRPPTFNINESTPYYGYYVLPPNEQGITYLPTENAYIGSITSDNIFSFKIIGHDFDGNVLTYTFADLPPGLTGNSDTGWITGNPVIADNSISEFSFSVAVAKAGNPAITTPSYNFSYRLVNNLVGDILWLTPENLGQIENSTVSVLGVVAESDVALEYRLVSGTLPPNLVLLSNGEITGTVAYQPTDTLLPAGAVTDFTFEVEAFSPLYSTVIKSTRTFTLSVLQQYTQPTDTLYIKCTPSIQDRNLLRTLLNNTALIPDSYLYRPEDSNFGKATDIIYAHAYGIYANDLDAYVAAVTKNHYWRNITLGELKTAVAKNEAGEVIYEVVYSSVIDNLVNPEGVSVSKEIVWPRLIDLNLGPWYTSVSNIYTSYINAPVEGQSLITQNNEYITSEDSFILETESGQPGFYASLTPGYATVLYPNSLPNMREQVGDELGQEYNFRLYPKWMTSQQANGSTLGFTPAWVIAYCKPGTTTLNGQTVTYGEYIKYQIENNWKDPATNYKFQLNEINFKIDRFIVDKSLTYNYDNNLSPATWTGLPSATPVPNPVNSNDFYTLFPRKTILPDETQY